MVYQEQTGSSVVKEFEVEQDWKEIVELYGKLWDSYWDTSPDRQQNRLRLMIKLVGTCRRYQLKVLEAAMQRWTTFGMLPLVSGLIGTALIVVYSAWVMSTCGSQKSLACDRGSIWSRLACLLMRPELTVAVILCAGMFSDCFSMLEATVARFTYVSYIIGVTVLGVARRAQRLRGVSSSGVGGRNLSRISIEDVRVVLGTISM